jgi:hypothetical protein
LSLGAGILCGAGILESGLLTPEGECDLLPGHRLEVEVAGLLGLYLSLDDSRHTRVIDLAAFLSQGTKGESE